MLFDDLRHISAHEAAERAGILIELRAGKAWARCPLHGEKTPSMRLYEEPGRGWYCFGCHRGGDAVKLYEEVFSLAPLDAARRLASDFGIPTDRPSGPPQPSVWNLRRALERFRGERLVALRDARRRADAVCRCRAAVGGRDALDDPVFTRALEARVAADLEIAQLETASLVDLAQAMEGGRSA